MSTPSHDDETAAQALVWPHFSQDRADRAALDCDANHGRGVTSGRGVEDPGAPHERVGATGQVDGDLVPGREVVPRGRERKGERRTGLPWRRRCLDRSGSRRAEGDVEGEEDGRHGEGTADERQAPGRAAGGPEERREVLGETRGGHTPTLGAPRSPGRRGQLVVEELLEADELVDDELSEDPDEELEPFAPAGVEELEVLSDELDEARESVR